MKMCATYLSIASSKFKEYFFIKNARTIVAERDTPK
jgi:hypothetical protein